jgi:DNA-binding CsgD family transcriptional regulator
MSQSVAPFPGTGVGADWPPGHSDRSPQAAIGDSLSAQWEDAESTLKRVLETVAGAAFFACATDVAAANELGRLALESEGETLRRTIFAAVATAPGTTDYMVTRSVRPGEFVIVRRGAAAEIERRLRTAADRWRISPRQAAVLRGLVNGQSNAEIAASLGCTPRTVETHMTALLSRADAVSRLSLVAAFWSDL